MRYGCLLTVALMTVTALAPRVRAGVYIPAEFSRWAKGGPTWLPEDDYDKFKLKLNLLRNIGIKRSTEELANFEQNDIFRTNFRYYQELTAALEAKQASGSLTTLDRINLGGCYLRLGGPGNEDRIEKAIAVLTTDARTPADPGNAFLLANLATALSLRQPLEPQRLQEAMDYLEMAIHLWPPVSAECPDSFLLNWFLRAEKLQYRLLNLRYREAIRSQGRIQQPAVLTVDDLFPVLQKVWARDGYEAGRLKPADAVEIPNEANGLLVQLIYWMPYDNRLFWLLAELQNAVHGRFKDTLDMLDLLSKTNYRLTLITQHRHILKLAELWTDTYRQQSARISRDQLLYSLGIPTGEAIEPELLPLFPLPLPAGSQSMLSVVGLVTAVNRAELDPAKQPDVAPVDRSDAAEKPAAGAAPSGLKWTVDWKAVAIGLVVGAFLALLGSQQWQQIQRRRQARAQSERHYASQARAKSDTGSERA